VIVFNYGRLSAWYITGTQASFAIAGEVKYRGSEKRKSPSGVQGQSPGKWSGKKSPEAEAYIAFLHRKLG